MSRQIFAGLMTAAIISASVATANAAELEKGNPSASYYTDNIVLSERNDVAIKEGYTALFINGTLVTEYEVIIRNERSLVPVRLVSEELGATVDWDGPNMQVTIGKGDTGILLVIDSDKALVNGAEVTLDHPAVLYNARTYVPLRFVAESLNATVEYAPRISSDAPLYYDTQMPVSSEKTLVRDYPNIIIDEKYDPSEAVTLEEAKSLLQVILQQGLNNFKLATTKSLVDSGEPADKFNSAFASIQTEINRMLYIGEVSRFFKFTIGPYDILYDKYNGRAFFEIYSSGTIVKEFDVDDPYLFTPVFIAG
ncbi:MAG: copper amine oxidase N-terminal domain-containing protein [Clostridiales bacterium]|nr:copper amine oxidase N-terminal domain-containing protein [Clostridiales bacterium]